MLFRSVSMSSRETTESPAQLETGAFSRVLSKEKRLVFAMGIPAEYEEGTLGGGDCCACLPFAAEPPFSCFASHRPHPTFSNFTSPFNPAPSPPLPRPSRAPTTSLRAFAGGIEAKPGTEVVR